MDPLRGGLLKLRDGIGVVLLRDVVLVILRLGEGEPLGEVVML